MNKNTLLWCILSIVLVAYLIAITCYTSYRSQKDLCSKVDIVLNDNSGIKFVTAEDINMEIGNDDNCFLSKSVSEINTHDLEKRLNSIDKIESANCVFYNKSRLRVEVTPLIPVARIFDGNKSYYINKDGKRMTANVRYHVDVPIISGKFGKSNDASSLLNVLNFIQADSAWNALISGIKVAKNHDIIITPMIKGHVINFGDTSLIENKFARIKTFYKEVMPQKGWNYYDTISVKWRGQVVATRREKRKQVVHLTQADSIDNEMISIGLNETIKVKESKKKENNNNKPLSEEKKSDKKTEKKDKDTNSDRKVADVKKQKEKNN